MALQVKIDETQFGELGDTEKTLYVEGEDGSYILDLDGVDNHPSVQSLRNGHKRSKTERDEAKRKAQALERRFGKLAEIAEDLDLSDVDEDRIAKLMPYLTGEADLPAGGDTDDRGNHKAPDLDKIKANARKPLERERDAAVERAEAAESKLKKLIVDGSLAEAIDGIKVDVPYKKAVKAMFRNQVKLAEGDDGETIAVIEGEYGEQPVSKYLKEWSQTDEGKAFILADDNGGGGARRNGTGGGKIKNPWAPDNWSPKEQARVFRELGRDTAVRMAAEHGKKVL